MVYLAKFNNYLHNDDDVIFHVDHQALLYMVRKSDLSGRMARWVLLLQEFDYSLIHTRGRSHIADYLSKLVNGESPTKVLDELPEFGPWACER